ncbi:hypothetical protein BRADI_2g08551v3 [Brachypodium distachyon]|uniref:Secreted protein n=1 Tax=Brachypodium distachyon TaxID=15368 RepID=A0A2K2D7I8_BRADI|nr:hypothetical protein BRADI_2g08551v3 [Brachypodium distachyon]
MLWLALTLSVSLCTSLRTPHHEQCSPAKTWGASPRPSIPAAGRQHPRIRDPERLCLTARWRSQWARSQAWWTRCQASSRRDAAAGVRAALRRPRRRRLLPGRARRHARRGPPVQAPPLLLPCGKSIVTFECLCCDRGVPSCTR